MVKKLEQIEIALLAATSVVPRIVFSNLPTAYTIALSPGCRLGTIHDTVEANAANAGPRHRSESDQALLLRNENRAEDVGVIKLSQHGVNP